MADVSLRVLLVGIDRTLSKALKGVGAAAHGSGTKMEKMGKIGRIAGVAMFSGLALAGTAAVKFGGDSLAAFADAEKSQAKLTDAYKRFPAVADVNIESLRQYNQAVQRKTGADADDIAASQANLAMFGLTGKQIKATTPLLVDYANKTGKSLPDAAKTMGKALLGNTKALKDMGISYKSTGDPAKDYANIMGLLKDKVGGYTASLPAAETQSKILAASFGDLQEEVGSKLQPVMMSLIDAGQGVMDWMTANPEVMAGMTAGFSLLGDAFKFLWDMGRKYILPFFATFVEGAGHVVEGLASMLEGLGNIPGFEWAKEAAVKMRETAKGILKVSDGLKALSQDPDPQIAIRDEATKKVTAIDKKIKSLKGKLVKAEARGDTKEVDALKKKIAALRGKKLTINANVVKTGVTSIKISKNSPASLRVMAGYRAGGRPRVGEIAQFHKDEYWVPDAAGSVVSQSRSRAMTGVGPLAMAGGGGATVVNNYYSANLHAAVVDPAGARAVEAALNRLSRSRNNSKGFKA